MPEILTESFCERCGTRYTFESAAPAKTKRGIGRFKTTAKGLRNYVMSDDTSLDEAMAAARNDDEREQTAQQLDAFHSTFNFCMTCRQYTCGNCWNTVEGRCLTCAPHLGHELVPAPFPALAPAPDARLEAWPEADLVPEGVAAEALAAEALAAEAVVQGDLDPIPEIDAADRLDRLAPTDDLDVVPTWLAAAEADALAAAEAQAAIEAVSDDGGGWPEDVAALAAAAEAKPEPAAIAEAADEEPTTATPVEVEAIGTEPVSADEAAEAEIAADAAEIAADADAAAAEVAADADAEIAAAAAADAASIEIAATAPAAEAEAEVAATADADATDGDVLHAAAIVAAAAAAEPELPAVAPHAEDADHRVAAAALATSALLAKFRPGQSIDAELEAYEASVAARDDERVPLAAEAEPVAAEPEALKVAAVAAAADAVTEPEPVLAESERVAAEPEPVVAEPGPVAAAPEPEPEPIAAASVEEPEPLAAAAAAALDPAPEPVAAASIEDVPALATPEPEPLAAAATADVPEPVRTDVVEQPTWRIVAPDTPAPVTNGHAPESLPTPAIAVPPPPATSGPPEWPQAPQWPQPSAAILANRAASSSAAVDALWAASVRDVVAPAADQAGAAGGVQPCNNCGLSLSSTARFCRRCGTRQS
ncbi:MAG: hypothetical protein ACJ77F_07435 [Chloroflexota bacterium]